MNYAREVYEDACVEFEEVSQQAHDLGLKTPDGAHARRNAVVQYQYRLLQYNQAIKRFADCMFGRTIRQQGLCSKAVKGVPSKAKAAGSI
jgi:hypothetical protein